MPKSIRPPWNVLSTIHAPATGTTAPVTWAQAINDNLNLLNDPPMARIERTLTNQSITADVVTTIVYDTVIHDTDDMVDMINFPSLIVIRRPGLYLLNAQISLTTTSNPARVTAALRPFSAVNGGVLEDSKGNSQSIDSYRSTFTLGALSNFTSTGWVDTAARYSHGSPVVVAGQTWLSATWLGPPLV
jgi:hypothetical protein